MPDASSAAPPGALAASGAPAWAALLPGLIDRHRHQPGALLPLLHALQDAVGHIPPEAVPAIAEALNLSRAEVHGVITYYHHFRQQPAGRHVVQVCQAESCQACGSRALTQAAERIFGCALGHTRPDGAVTLEAVYCLGLCAQSPAIQVDARPHARMSEAKLTRIAEQLGVAAPAAQPEAV